MQHLGRHSLLETPEIFRIVLTTVEVDSRFERFVSEALKSCVVFKIVLNV
jgi:hypothetical protein